MRSSADLRPKIVPGLYVACFGAGALNHARDFLNYGWRPYNWGPHLLEMFWTSLIALDLIAIGLILSKFRRAGLCLAAAIMLADVAANTYALVVLGIPAFGLAVPLQGNFPRLRSRGITLRMAAKIVCFCRF
jgi:hypothetical protein